MSQPAASLERTRRHVARRVRQLRKDRGWTQAELAARLGLSQSRLSEIERGDGSFSAEQLIEVLSVFNVDLGAVAPTGSADAELQNTLARLGALHLLERDDVVPSGRFRDVGDALRETLAEPRFPRAVSALVPVLVWNIDSINLGSLYLQLEAAGLGRRLGWLAENALLAIVAVGRGPPAWGRRARRAQVVLRAFLDQLARRDLPATAPPPDVLDANIRTTTTLKQVAAAASAESHHWGIVSAIQPADFAEALRSAHESG